MTPALRSMDASLGSVISSFDALQASSSNAFDDSSAKAYAESCDHAADAMHSVEREIRQADDSQNRFNREIRDGVSAADGLDKKFGAIARTVATIFSINKIKNWVTGNLGLYDEAKNTERQLKTVLANVGAAKDAYGSLQKTAAALQKTTLYGKDSMLAGAAEFATYINDPKAIEKMMGTLSNYAAGMSGGGEVGKQQMVEYATQLGKALDGTFDGLKKKGFELTKAQQKIIDKGTDMQKALVIDEVISQSWDNLATQMANTPIGKITQIKNEMSDLGASLGERLYAAVMPLIDLVLTYMPQIEAIMYGLTDACSILILVITGIVEAGFQVYQFFVDNWSWIAPIIYGIVAALIAYNAVSVITNTISAISAMREAAKAAATAMATGATFAQTAAQYGLNAALMASPVTWVIMGIIALIAAIYAVIGVINKVTGSTISATGVIVGAFYWAGGLIWDVFLGLLDLVLGVVNFMVNPFIQFANFLFNVFKSPISSIIRLFEGLADNVIGIIESIARAIDSVFGGNLAGTVSGWRSGLRSMADELVKKYAPNENYKDKGDLIRVTAYDQLRYLKNKDTYVYANKTASDLVRMIASDFQLNLGTVEDTGFVIASRVEDNKTLFDIIQTALDLTLTSRGQMYCLYDDFGSLCLKNVESMTLNLLLDEETGQNYDYQASIDDDTYNRIKLVYENEKTGKREVYIAKDSSHINDWGVLHTTHQ